MSVYFNPDPWQHLAAYQTAEPYPGKWPEKEAGAIAVRISQCLPYIAAVDPAVARAAQSTDILPFGARFFALQYQDTPVLLALNSRNPSEPLHELLTEVIPLPVVPAIPDEPGLFYLQIQCDGETVSWNSARAGYLRGGPIMVFGPVARDPLQLALALGHEAAHVVQDISSAKITVAERQRLERICLDFELRVCEAISGGELEGATPRRIAKQRKRIEMNLEQLEGSG